MMKAAGLVVFFLLPIALLVVSVVVSDVVHALSAGPDATVASPFVVRGEVSDGDIVSYDSNTGTCHPSKLPEDEMMFGVVVLDPVMYMTDGEEEEGMVPIVRYGNVVVNVSDATGAILAGDLVTTSLIAGKGQRISRERGAYVMGFALEDMVLTGETVEIDGNVIRMGKVPVALRIGPYVSGQSSAFLASTTAMGYMPGSTQPDGERGLDIFKMFRYLLASIVAVGTVIIAARRFGDAFSQSVISVGRNPMARSQIRSMVLWNAFLLVVISGIGLGVAVAIIMAP